MFYSRMLIWRHLNRKKITRFSGAWIMHRIPIKLLYFFFIFDVLSCHVNADYWRVESALKSPRIWVFLSSSHMRLHTWYAPGERSRSNHGKPIEFQCVKPYNKENLHSVDIQNLDTSFYKFHRYPWWKVYDLVYWIAIVCDTQLYSTKSWDYPPDVYHTLHGPLHIVIQCV